MPALVLRRTIGRKRTKEIEMTWECLDKDSFFAFSLWIETFAKHLDFARAHANNWLHIFSGWPAIETIFERILKYCVQIGFAGKASKLAPDSSTVTSTWHYHWRREKPTISFCFKSRVLGVGAQVGLYLYWIEECLLMGAARVESRFWFDASLE